MNSKISLITPSYNQASYLEKALQSVLMQRDCLYEYHLLDGGSSDGSVEIIERYRELFTSYESRKDNGQTAALVKGFAGATGNIFGWLNSDDVLLPNSLSIVLDQFDMYPEVDIVSGYLVLIDQNSNIISLPRVPSGNRFLNLNGLILINQQATFFKRELYEKVGGLDESLHCAMDLDLWARFILAGAKWRHVPCFLAGFRHHGESKGSGGRWADLYADEFDMVKKRYPDIYSRIWAKRLAIMAHFCNQLFSGRQIASFMQKKRWQGKSLDTWCTSCSR